MIDVNLLPEQKIIARQDFKLKLYAVLAIVFATIVSTLAVLGVTSFKVYQERQISGLEQRKVAANERLLTLSEVATDLLTLKKKAKGVEVVEKSKYDFKSAFGYVTGLLPGEIKLDEIRINNDGEVVLTLTSGNASEIAKYIAQVTKDKELKESKLSKLTTQDDNQIKFSIGSLYGKSKNTGGNN